MAPAIEHVDHRHSTKATKMDRMENRSNIHVEINRKRCTAPLPSHSWRAPAHPFICLAAPKQSITNVGVKHGFRQKSLDCNRALRRNNRNFEGIRERAARITP